MYPGNFPNPEFVYGVSNAEDLVRLIGTPWIVATQLNFDHFDPRPTFRMGPLKAIRVDTCEAQTLYPAPDSGIDWDRETYPDRQVPAQIFSPIGLNVQPLGGGCYRLYVANHGGGKSVEIVDVAVGNEQLHSTWRGSVRVPETLGVWPNGVAPLPEGGLVLSGVGVATWSAEAGWRALECRKGRGSNGVEVSRDGRWIFVADFPSRSVVRVSIEGHIEETIARNLDFFPDNLRWGEDGMLYVAGPDWPAGFALEESFKKTVCDFAFGIAQIDPQTLSSRTIFRSEGIHGIFGAATTALQIGDAFWVGTVRGDRIMIIPLEHTRAPVSKAGASATVIGERA